MKIAYKVNGRQMDREEFLSSSTRDGIREILESGEFPGLQTDDEFMSRRGTLADQLGPQTEDVVRAAKRHGYTPNYTDVYLPAAARFPGDPEAFVRHDSARGKLKKTFEDRGWECDGSVRTRGREAAPKEVMLADDIIAEEASKIRRLDKAASLVPDKELRQHIIDKYGAK